MKRTSKKANLCKGEKAVKLAAYETALAEMNEAFSSRVLSFSEENGCKADCEDDGRRRGGDNDDFFYPFFELLLPV